MNKRTTRIVVISLAAVVLITASVVGVLAIRKSNITLTNAAVKAGREAFLEARYKTALIHFRMVNDSLKMDNDGVALNIAHAQYLMWQSEKGQTKSPEKNSAGVDPLAKTKADTTAGRGAMDYYSPLTTNKTSNAVSSIAYNQMGVLNYAVSKPNVTDDILQSSASYFKTALKKDPNNEAARYNYELIQKKLAYPGIVMNHVRALVKQQKYTEAYQLLEGAVKRDPSIETKNPGYRKRLEDIIKINHD